MYVVWLLKNTFTVSVPLRVTIISGDLLHTHTRDPRQLLKFTFAFWVPLSVPFPLPRLSFYLSLILSSSSSPDSSLDELEKLLVLLLGCVVQCEGRGPLIERMTTMGIMQQQALVVYIKEMTDTTNYVCSIDWNDLGEISRK